MPAEGAEVEFQLAAHPRVVGDAVEDMDLMVDILDVFQRGEGYALDLREALPVAVVPKEDGVGRLAVTSGSARFLEIGLGAVREVDMDHEPDVGFVDAHAEGVGANHHADPVRLPVLLPEGAGGGADAGVVERGGDAAVTEQGGEFLGLFPVADIHDA